MRYLLSLWLCFSLVAWPGRQLRAQQPEVVPEPEVELILPSEVEPVPEYEWKPEASEPVVYERFDEETHASLQRELDYSGTPAQAERRRQHRRNQNRNRSNQNIPDAYEEESSSSDWQIGNIRLSNTAFILIVLLLIAGLGFFLYQYFDMTEKRTKGEATNDLQLELENIEEENLSLSQTETLLEKAERLGDFTTAVRLQYLALLKQLQELGMIQYQRDKTDREYRREMDKTELGDVFSEITIDYARNWYGQYPLDRLSYRLVAERFERLRNHLSTQAVPTYG
ncbi:MAG: hypothetical protein AAF433_00840 [Bacteroidota bacterium]